MLLYVAIGCTLVFAFVNGFHDGCNVIATIISSRSMRPRRALVLASLAELVGPLVLGTAVAVTIADSVLRVELMRELSPMDVHLVVIAATGGAILWNLVTWWLGLPSSSSHALVGGLCGSGLVFIGLDAVALDRIVHNVVLPLFLSPVIGVVIGYVIFAVVRGLFGQAHASARHFFVAAQKPAMMLLAASHGSNDAQKSMGLIAMALAGGVATGGQRLPLWVIAACGLAIALGLSTGGWRIVKTVGYGIFRMQPVHSFASQLSSGAVVLGASLIGGPVSTTQVVSSTVMGVGASRRLSAVRWMAARNIMYAWILTIPATGAISAGASLLLRLALSD